MSSKNILNLFVIVNQEKPSLTIIYIKIILTPELIDTVPNVWVKK